MKQSTLNLMNEAEGLQNTITERVLPGIDAAIRAIREVGTQSDILRSIAGIRAAADNLDGSAQALHISADLLEAANKDGNAISLMINLQRLNGIAEGLQIQAGALQRHGPSIRAAVADAVLSEKDMDIELHPETGSLIMKVAPEIPEAPEGSAG